jgi:transposase, IS605 orfB family
LLKKKFTIVTQLHTSLNKDLIDYIDKTLPFYSKAVRESFHTIKNSKSFNKSNYNSYLQQKYDITKRTANSIISDAQGRLNALIELKQYEQKQLKLKISNLEKNIIPKLVQKREINSKILNCGGKVSFIKQRNLRLKIVSKKNKLNCLKQKLSNITYQIENKKIKLCFGTRDLLKRDYQKFKQKRDSQLSFVGCKSEPGCNQQLQLVFNPKNNQFKIKLRKDFGFKKSKGKDKIVEGQVYFRNHKNKIVSILKNKNSPLTYKIIKNNNRFYLYCTFEIQLEKEDYLTRSNYGTIGLDFNKGFVTLSETNNYGDLIDVDIFRYRFRSGKKTKTDLQKIANEVVQLSREKGKDLCIENLNFKKTKSKTDSKIGKQYNQMIHSLAYSQFINLIENSAFKNSVRIIKVNPAWTSWLAKKLYCPTMKLNIHIGAAYVIARRGQGYKDSF